MKRLRWKTVIWLLKAIIPSIIFNFRHLPFRIAWKIPILVSKGKFYNCKGKFIFNCPVKFGLIQLGKNLVCLYPNNGITLENTGTIIFNGKLTVGNSSSISVGPTGVLEFGVNVTVTASLKLACYNSIKFHDNVLIGWDCMIMDTDFHKIKFVSDSKKLQKGYGAISVGVNTWIANSCKLYKNTTIPKNCIVGADTIIHGPVKCNEYSLITNDIKTVIKVENVYLDRSDDVIVYSDLDNID